MLDSGANFQLPLSLRLSNTMFTHQETWAAVKPSQTVLYISAEVGSASLGTQEELSKFYTAWVQREGEEEWASIRTRVKSITMPFKNQFLDDL